MSAPPRVLVVGAGACGLTACKALLDRGIDFVCCESGDRVGGMWVFGNSNGRSAAYRSLHINTSRRRSQFADYPMPDEYPDYPSHGEIAAYLDGYAARFGLDRSVRFNTTVKAIRPAPNGGFTVETEPGFAAPEHFTAVVVANGHHWEPRWPTPKPEGSFSGIELHAHAYRDPHVPAPLAGRRVVVVGFGNSAVDIACELAKSGGPGRVFLSVRRGAWVLPKYALGKPLDQASSWTALLPRALRRRVAELWYRRVVGDPSSLGLPAPDHRLGDAHPTLSDELPRLLRSGYVVPKPAIASRAGSRVSFADGSTEQVEAIVYATGYQIAFPFFDPAFVSAPDNELPLYKRVFHPTHHGLFFVGFCQPLGPIFPIAEAQARLVAASIAGSHALPPRSTMCAAIDAERERVRKRFGSSPRHTMQVDFDDYLAELRAELSPLKAAR